MSLNSKERLYEKLKDKKYRDEFVSSRISQTLALQARVLRQEAGLSQDELAEELHTSQNAISRLENPGYGKHSTSTLKKYASYFDVGLIIRFVPYSRLVDWTTNLDDNSILVPPFEEDNGFVPPATVRSDAPRSSAPTPPGRDNVVCIGDWRRESKVGQRTGLPFSLAANSSSAEDELAEKMSPQGTLFDSEANILQMQQQGAR
jgi:transcriptional regulator with XRE-family HTH domain